MPSVQVVIPAMRARNTAIQSVARQTFKDFDLTIVREKGIGPGRARNIGVAQGRSEWVAFLDDDDVWDKEYLSVAMFNTDNADFLFSCPNYGLDTCPEIPRERMVYILNNGASFAQGSGILIRRETFNALGGFDEVSQHSEVWLLCAQIVFSGVRIKHITENLWRKGKGENQLSLATSILEIRTKRRRMLESLFHDNHL